MSFFRNSGENIVVTVSGFRLSRGFGEKDRKTGQRQPSRSVGECEVSTPSPPARTAGRGWHLLQRGGRGYWAGDPEHVVSSLHSLCIIDAAAHRFHFTILPCSSWIPVQIV